MGLLRCRLSTSRQTGLGAQGLSSEQGVRGLCVSCICPSSAPWGDPGVPRSLSSTGPGDTASRRPPRLSCLCSLPLVRLGSGSLTSGSLSAWLGEPCEQRWCVLLWDWPSADACGSGVSDEGARQPSVSAGLG